MCTQARGRVTDADVKDEGDYEYKWRAKLNRVTTHVSLFFDIETLGVQMTPSVSINTVKFSLVNTHVKCVLVDHKHAHVLGQQFAGMTCKEEN